MTNEEAITELKKHISPYTNCKADADANDAIDMAIKALEQQPCEDCISREAVLETIEDCNSDGLKGIFCSYNDGERFKEYIKALPSVTPKEKTAAWVTIDAEPHDICECNACGWLLYYEDRTDFKCCPNCGAKMVGDTE